MSLKGGALAFPLSSHTAPVREGLNVCFQSSFCVHVDKVADLHLDQQTVAFLIKQGLLQLSSNGLTTSQKEICCSHIFVSGCPKC